ncbi:hypothetical protein [Nitrosomonas sp.]|uniref:hypothetical protein n=1 Tax=Nitrosomonas sp. TaxID=42353 RepID=UPI0025D45AB4|nr:hypothetical protein [Nitrosomonas sp.]
MLTGKELGVAIKEAIDLKIASGAVASKKEIADYFGMRPPSLHDWINKGTISKDKLPKLWAYFSDVVGPEHWGLSENPSFPYPQQVQEEVELLEILGLDKSDIDLDFIEFIRLYKRSGRESKEEAKRILNKKAAPRRKREGEGKKDPVD